MGGFPEHGDELVDEADAFAQDEGFDEGIDDDGPPPREEEPAYIKAMRDEIAALRADNNTIKRAVPPPEPPRAAAEDEVDIDELLFSDPKEALRLTREQVKQELRAEYTREQGTSKFWTDFFAAHADLKDDKDLVDLELTKNMDRLGGMDVKKAIDELADLTRTRILGYTRKGSGRKQSRAVAEGASQPAPRQAAQTPSNVTTLTDLLRARREKRRKGASAA
jgi:hypothetical protein